MQHISLDKLPSQTIQATLDKQHCKIELTWRQRRLYLSLWVNDEPVSFNEICLNRTSIIQVAQTAFTGTLHFIDLQGDEAPHWEGLNHRYFLLYLPEDDEKPAGLMF